MKQLVKSLAAYWADLILVGGAVAVAVGAGMIYLPAGLIVGGGLAVAGAALSIMGEDDDK